MALSKAGLMVFIWRHLPANESRVAGLCALCLPSCEGVLARPGATCLNQAVVHANPVWAREYWSIGKGREIWGVTTFAFCITPRLQYSRERLNHGRALEALLWGANQSHILGECIVYLLCSATLNQF